MGQFGPFGGKPQQLSPFAPLSDASQGSSVLQALFRGPFALNMLTAKKAKPKLRINTVNTFNTLATAEEAEDNT